MWGFRQTASMIIAAAFAAIIASCGTPATMGAPGHANHGGPIQDVPVREYKLGPGDQLHVVVFGQSGLSGQFVVSVQGTIAYPLIGDIQASGLTVNAFSQALVARLREGYVREPNVSVEITTYRPFYILGEVRNPGTYPFSPGLTVVRAVATAGGFTDRANTRRVFVQHSDETAERQYLLTTGTPVEPGDTVRIPERLF